MLVKSTGEEHKAVLRKAWQTIGLDLAAQGITDAQIEGLNLDGDIDTEHPQSPLRGWEFTVNFKDARAPFVYRLDNAKGAELRRLDGQPLRVPAPASGEDKPQ